MLFSLFQKQIIKGPIVDLKVLSESDPTPFNDFAHTIQYGIYRHGEKERIGECDLRIGENDILYYAGNIGYRIYAPFRGHGYAYEACLLILKQAKDVYMMDRVLLTCSPENTASEKTILKLGAELLETTDVPVWHWLYKRGETQKKIYIIRL